MKATEHKATFDDCLAYLSLNGPSFAEEIGAHLWPDKVGYGPARGGPPSCAVAASWMLGKMRRAGLVETYQAKRTNYRKWVITVKGEERLMSKHRGTAQKA